MNNLVLYKGQADIDVQDAIAEAANLPLDGSGVTPADYTTANHYLYHQMFGQNVRCAPVLLGLEYVAIDPQYPSRKILHELFPDTQPDPFPPAPKGATL